MSFEITLEGGSALTDSIAGFGGEDPRRGRDAKGRVENGGKKGKGEEEVVKREEMRGGKGQGSIFRHLFVALAAVAENGRRTVRKCDGRV